MATIDLSKAHTLPLDEARKKAEDIARSMEAKFSIQWRWDGPNIVFDTPSGAAKGVKGKLAVSEKQVRIEIDLPFLLRAIKGTIEDRVKEKLDQLA
jgi:putative polyhydroxyalkanoate system protein